MLPKADILIQEYTIIGVAVGFAGSYTARSPVSAGHLYSELSNVIRVGGNSLYVWFCPVFAAFRCSSDVAIIFTQKVW